VKLLFFLLATITLLTHTHTDTHRHTHREGGIRPGLQERVRVKEEKTGRKCKLRRVDIGFHNLVTYDISLFGTMFPET
jgi:hypothetical protein